jgi:hypothetical protein
VASLRIVNAIDGLRAALLAAQADQSALAQAAASAAAAAASSAAAQQAAQQQASAAQQQYNDAQSAAQKAGEAAAKLAEQTAIPNYANSRYRTEADLLNAKLAQLQRDDPKGNWTLAKLNAIIDRDTVSGTTAEWYRLYGAAEGFAVGGLATPGIALVGEEGPELVDFSSRAMIYPADDTRRILDSMSSRTGQSAEMQRDADRAMVQELREQNSLLRAILMKLISVDKNGRQSMDYLDILAGDSLKTQRAETPPAHRKWVN